MSHDCLEAEKYQAKLLAERDALKTALTALVTACDEAEDYALTWDTPVTQQEINWDHALATARQVLGAGEGKA